MAACLRYPSAEACGCTPPGSNLRQLTDVNARRARRDRRTPLRSRRQPPRGVPSGCAGGRMQVENRVSSPVIRNAIALASAALLIGAASAAAQTDIVLQASKPSAKAGKWAIVRDSGAIGGAKIRQADSGAAKITTASAKPANYFELTFRATEGVPYRLWIHGRADGNGWGNDSVFVQFSG